MYCTYCGSSLETQTRFCPGCGKSTRPGEGEDRVVKHRWMLSMLWFVVGGYRLLSAAVLFALPEILRATVGPRAARPEVEYICQLIAVLLVVGGVAALATGWGLYNKESWGRMLALVMGFLALPLVPVMTALGIYTLWVLLPRESAESYRQLAHTA